ncbi:PQQ-binding-like beta-propeller repeat protein [Longibacter salinarum]|nr:PQQ-binding-like beta-propeller repeat protein [Longibacter salinarum]
MISPIRILVSGRLLVVLAVGLLFAGCSSGTVTPTITDNDLKRTGAYPGAAPTLNTSVWTFQAPGRSGDDYGRIESAPAIGDSVVYVGSYDGHLYAVDRSTGEQKWAFDTQASIEHAPALADSIVFFGSGGTLYAVNVETQEEMWRYEEGLASGDPIVHGDIVLFGDLDGHVYALDHATGEEQWRFDAGSQVKHAPALANGRLYVMNGDAELFALSLDSGDVTWSVHPDVETRPIGSPVVSQGTVYAANMEGRLYAFDESTGEEQWQASLSGAIHRSPTLYDGVLYYRTSCDAGTCLSALQADTGQQLWQAEFDVEPYVTALASSGGVLYVGGAGGLYAVDAETRKQIGKVAVEDGVRSTAIIRDGRLYFASSRYLQAVE